MRRLARTCSKPLPGFGERPPTSIFAAEAQRDIVTEIRAFLSLRCLVGLSEGDSVLGPATRDKLTQEQKSLTALKIWQSGCSLFLVASGEQRCSSAQGVRDIFQI